MKYYQEREFSRTLVRPEDGVHDCMDGGGTTPRTGEVEQRTEQLPRAPKVGALGDAGAVAEGCTS